MSKKAQIPLREMLKAIDLKDLDFYTNLTAEQKEAFSPWLAMRYISSAQGNDAYHYLLMVNPIVNADFNTLKKHPELQWKLLATCGSGRSVYHPWIAPGKKKKKDKIRDFLRSVYQNLNNKELDLLISLNTTDDLKQLAKDNGLEEKDIEEIFS